MARALEHKFDCERICLIPPGTMSDHKGHRAPGLFAFVRIVDGLQHEVVVDISRVHDEVTVKMLAYVTRNLAIGDPAKLAKAAQEEPEV